MASATPSQLYIRARILLIAALVAIGAAFVSVMIWAQEKAMMVLVLLVVAAVLFIVSTLVRRAADTKRMGPQDTE